MSIAFHSYVRRLRLCSATSSRAWPRGPWRAGWGMCPRWEEQYKKHENHQGPSFTFYIYIYITIFHLFFSSFVGLDPFLRIASFGWRISEGPIGGVFWAKAELKNHKMTRHQWGQKRWMKLDYITYSGGFNHACEHTTYIYAHMYVYLCIYCLISYVYIYITCILDTGWSVNYVMIITPTRNWISFFLELKIYKQSVEDVKDSKVSCFLFSQRSAWTF